MKIFEIQKVNILDNIKLNIKSLKESLSSVINKKLFLFIFLFSVIPLLMSNYISLESITALSDKSFRGLNYANLIFNFFINILYIVIMLSFFALPFYKDNSLSSFLKYFKRKRFYFSLSFAFVLFTIFILLTISLFSELALFLSPELKSKFFAIYEYNQGIIENIPKEKTFNDFDYKVMYGSFIGGMIFSNILFYIVYQFTILNIQKNTSTILNIKIVFKNIYKNFFNIIVDILFIALIIFSLLFFKEQFLVFKKWYISSFLNTFIVIFSSYFIYSLGSKYFKKETHDAFE